MPDLYAISNAIAGRFAAGQVTPPAGYTNVRVSTADTEAAVSALPCVYVFPQEGAFDTGNGTRLGTFIFTVRFYFAERRDTRRDDVALQKWATVLVDQLKLSAQLGGTVARATVDGFRIGVLPYGNKDYSGVELDVGIVASEAWAAVA